MAYFEVGVECSTQDLHSGVYGGTVHEAMTDLIRLMGSLVEPDGTILVGEIGRGAKRRTGNGIAGKEKRTSSYFSTRRTFPVTTTIILTHCSNPFRDSLHSSQTVS